MSHSSLKILDKEIKKVSKLVTVGGTYFHYKNPDNYYVIESIGLIEENQKPAVIYRALYGKGIVWVRPLKEFMKKFTKIK